MITHGDLAFYFCAFLTLASVWIVPVAILVCLLVRPWRHITIYFAIYAAFYALCWGLMLLAPAPFLNWWWD